MDSYEFPARLVTKIIEELCAAGIASKVLISNSQELYGFQLAMAPEELTVEYLLKNVYNLGASDFIPDFNNRFPGVTKISQNIANALSTTTSKTLLSDIEIKY